jgi:hypothetical protein
MVNRTSNPNTVLTTFATNVGTLLLDKVPGSALPVFGNLLTAYNVFSSLYRVWRDAQDASEEAEKQNLLAQYQRDKYNLQNQIRQSANYLSSMAVLEQGREYVGELQNAFIRAGVSARSGTAANQMARIDAAFKTKAMLARQGIY